MISIFTLYLLYSIYVLYLVYPLYVNVNDVNGKYRSEVLSCLSVSGRGYCHRPRLLGIRRTYSYASDTPPAGARQAEIAYIASANPSPGPSGYCFLTEPVTKPLLIAHRKPRAWASGDLPSGFPRPQAQQRHLHRFSCGIRERSQGYRRPA